MILPALAVRQGAIAAKPRAVNISSLFRASIDEIQDRPLMKIANECRLWGRRRGAIEKGRLCRRPCVYFDNIPPYYWLAGAFCGGAAPDAGGAAPGCGGRCTIGSSSISRSLYPSCWARLIRSISSLALGRIL